jgi:hypothetical protein
MAITVTTERHSMGDLACVVNKVTGDGTLKTWDTGLNYVLFYMGTTPDDEHCIVDEWYYNTNDKTTVANGHVYFDEAAPDTGEVWTCFGIGK